MGINAGAFNQGDYSIAIGPNAGQSGQWPSSIVLNASIQAINPSNSGFYVNPVRSETGATSSATMRYNPVTDEITYNNEQIQTSQNTVAAGNVHYSLRNAAGTPRWAIGALTAETTLNVGTDLAFISYNDNGSYFSTVMTMRRSNSCIGIGLSTPTAQLHLSRDSAQKPTTNAWTVGSDERIKKDIVPANLDLCYSTVKNLQLKYFKWDENYIKNVASDKHSLGFIAQQVKEIFPNSVEIRPGYGYDNFHSLNTDQIDKTHFGATQHLIHVVDSQASTLASQEATLASQASLLAGQASLLAGQASTLTAYGAMLETLMARQ
jgi:hypothetical protein